MVISPSLFNRKAWLEHSIGLLQKTNKWQPVGSVNLPVEQAALGCGHATDLLSAIPQVHVEGAADKGRKQGMWVSCQAREWRENSSGMTDTTSGLAVPLRPHSRTAEGSGVPCVNHSAPRCSHYTTVHGAMATAALSECQNLLQAPGQEWGLLCLEMAASTAVKGLWTLAYQPS